MKSNQPLFNDGFPTLIVMPRASDVVHLRKKEETITLSPVWICCGVIQDTHWEMPEGLEYILVFRFKPSAFYSLFGVDPAVFQSTPVQSLKDIVDIRWASVIDEMYRKETALDRVAYLNDVFAAYQTDEYLPYFLQVAIDHIEDQKGNTTVSELLARLGGKVNHKWLHRNFVKYLGISPKRYISLQRFIYAYGHFDADNSPDLFDVALKAGYYDYNHFLKEFKQYLGVAPSRYSWG
ncbi:helix-turn-helix domain-containing protein [Parapedobacter deserti]|uniref:Helix-turn-helix domain-containing protein n=1 Tax=Parapedobacter deserti TaxID=1912957 RepID=A0ABV7JF91_9SPHI